MHEACSNGPFLRPWDLQPSRPLETDVAPFPRYVDDRVQQPMHGRTETWGISRWMRDKRCKERHENVKRGFRRGE